MAGMSLAFRLARYSRSFGAGLSNSRPALPLSQGSKSFPASKTGMRSRTSATNSFGSVMIIVQDLSVSPLARSNSQKGYGFIQPQGGSKDVFVHISAVERAGLSSLNEGQVVEYEEVSNKGKMAAENLKVQR